MIRKYQEKRKGGDINSVLPLLVVFFPILLLVIPCVSTAGGLYLNEFGTPSMGVAGAGASAVASDASTSFHNPAGMTRIKGNELMGTAGLLNATVEFDPDANTPVSGGDGGNAGGLAPIIGGFYVHSLSDKWKVGANLITITGAVLDYDDDWTGRYLNTEVTLLTMTFFPTVAYQVNDWLSLGGGPQIMYADLEMKAKIPLPKDDGKVKIDGDDVAYGFGLGALVELSERTRFGLVYQSEIEPEFDGDVKISGPGTKKVGTDTKITLAQFIKVSGYHELNDRWALLGTVGWEDWSAFKNVNISTDQDTQKIPRDWKDTWKFAAGVHFRPVDNWLLQVGFSYDTSPVDSDDRTPDMPMDRQIRYAAGAQYKWSDRLSTGAQFVYADYGNAKIDNDLLKGDYKRNDIFFFALNANWKF
ncbi:MAG: outer membrane protein transport protein [Deltaproteobacteria bacterium]|jgi:long-chain fatty acid transport protein|nr:outer membrane protein transport protein [Deltaproteobacteria bacterium]MBW2584091.1 outer membrane protein transport protein [Deltaproteobacteria bacterium]